jgi:hypothetical protein
MAMLGDAAFSSPLPGQGTGLARVGAYQEIGRLHARSVDVPGPDAEPSPQLDAEGLTDLVERAVNGVEPPDYAAPRWRPQRRRGRLA